jgi:hypothetical protein
MINLITNSFLRLFYLIVLLLQFVASLIMFMSLFIPVWLVLGSDALFRFFNILIDALNSTLNKIPN